MNTHRTRHLSSKHSTELLSARFVPSCPFPQREKTNGGLNKAGHGGRAARSSLLLLLLLAPAAGGAPRPVRIMALVFGLFAAIITDPTAETFFFNAC